MLRQCVIGFLGCLYVAASVWIVLSEGDSYRKTIVRATTATEGDEHGAKGSLKDNEPTGAKPARAGPSLAGSAEQFGDPARQSPAPPPAERKMPQTDSSNPPVDPKQAATAAPVQSVPQTSVAKEQGQPTSIRPPTQTSAISTAAAAKVARNQDGFWDQPLLKKNWDVAYLKTDDEYRLGLELQELILKFNPRLATGPWQRRVEEAAEPLLNTVNRKDVRYTFTVLDSDQPNAFSHPGGFIYVTRGLLEMIGEDEDDALEFAVGHEMAHVDLKHAIKTLQDPGVAKLTSGTLQKLYMLIIPLAYLDAQEFEADEWIYRRMKQLHQSDRECLRFLNKLESYSKREGFDNGRGVLKLDADSSPVENHLRAHTAPYKRLKHLKEIMGKNSNPSK